jgi:hypothetical protein
LYLSLGNFKHAAFCYEELILLNPLDGFNHSRLAEVQFLVLRQFTYTRYTRVTLTLFYGIDLHVLGRI